MPKRRQGLAAHRVVQEVLGPEPGGGFEFLGVGQGHGRRALVIHHQGLELLGAHQGPQAAPARGAARPAVGVGEMDGGAGEALFPGLADAHDPDTPAEALPQAGHGVVVPEAGEVVGRQKLHPVLGDFDERIGIVDGMALHHHGLDAQPGQLDGDEPPGIAFLDAAGKGDLPPTEMRPALAAGAPVRSPGARTSLLAGPRGWQAGGTSSRMRREVRARPPSPA